MSGAHKLGVLVIHGMGTPQHRVGAGGRLIPTFHEDMAQEINRRVDRLGLRSRDIAWEPVFWHPVIGPIQNALLERLEDAGTEWNKGRRFVLSALGDASSYTYGADRGEGSVYDRVHRVIYEAVQRLRHRLERPDRPLVWFANSLGGIMMSDYIWDRRWYELKRKDDPYGTNNFERMRTLSGILTFGCNIPLFVHGFQPLQAIDFPHPDLDASLRDKARWHNYYDTDDILGYPLAPLGGGYKDLADAGYLLDHSIESGPIWSKWSPDSHRHYWTDNDFTRPAAQFLGELLA